MLATTKEMNKIFKTIFPNTGFILPALSEITYPVIPDNTSNFISDYQSNYASFDRMFLRNHGEKYYESLGTPLSDSQFAYEWHDDIKAICLTHIDSWARLYYALSLDYNPIYNVDGITTTQYGSHTKTDTIGERKTTDSFGASQETFGYGASQETFGYGATQQTNSSRNDESKKYDVGYDSTTEKETGKQTDSIGSQTISNIAHTDTKSALAKTDTKSALAKSDTHTTNQTIDSSVSGVHTDTITKKGNQGITMTQTMLESEYEFRKRDFFNMIFKTVSEELGLFYMEG